MAYLEASFAVSSGPAGKPQALSALAVYRASPLERIAMVRRGIPAAEAKRIFADLHIGQSAGFKALNLSTATVNRRPSTAKPSPPKRASGLSGSRGWWASWRRWSRIPAIRRTSTPVPGWRAG